MRWKAINENSTLFVTGAYAASARMLFFWGGMWQAVEKYRRILCANVEGRSFNQLAFLLSSEKSAIFAHEFPYKHEGVECGYAVAHNVCHKLTFCIGTLWCEQSFPKGLNLFSFFLDISLQFIFAGLKVCKGVVLVVVCCHFVRG